MKPRIRRQDWSPFGEDSRETCTEVGWPRLYVSVLRHYHTWKGEETRSDSEWSFVLGPFRGVVLGGSFGTGCYPDTDEEGWPQ